MMFVLYPDLNLCVSCKTCEIACAIEHSKGKNLLSALMERVKSHMDVVFVGIPVPMNCRHCIDAPCPGVCPTEAIERNPTGPIVIDQSKCIGYKSCAVVCPFGAIRFERTASKCDQCIERLEIGRMPACVESCPVGALKFEKADELSDQ
ncbi:MAG: 4Fe-4S binding protein [Deltaproteobacteria bacterium]|nr:4Fe-4S binding protein [Deltaproteobacteria bacterium]